VVVVEEEEDEQSLEGLQMHNQLLAKLTGQKQEGVAEEGKKCC
jgi:hypothetical protein